MNNYEYKVVPFQGNIQSGKNLGDVSLQLEILMNNAANDGWEFIELGDVAIKINPGCIWAFFGASASYLRYDQLVFRRPL